MFIRNFFTGTLIVWTLLSAQVQADLVFDRWSENITITEQGQKVEVDAEAHVKLPANYYYDRWSYQFDKESSIEVQEAQVNGASRFSFSRNELVFDCGRLVNGDKVRLRFVYIEREANTKSWFIRSWVQIPSWLSGIQGYIKVTIPDTLKVCSIHQGFSHDGTVYEWRGVVPKGGFKSLFQLTPRSGAWDVTVQNQLASSRSFSKVELWYPRYFEAGSQSFSDYRLIPYISADREAQEGRYHHLVYARAGVKELMTTIKASVFTGGPVIAPLLSPAEYLRNPTNEERTLKKLTEQVLQKNTAALPLYVFLGQWVHAYVTYAFSMNGRTVSTLQIIEGRRGVCEHFAQLYTALCRSAGIPAVMVSGYAYNAERGWQEHAWVMVYVSGSWIPVDPTWGLFSGVVPVSHIAFYYEGVHSSKYVMEDTNSEVRASTTVTVTPR